MNLEQRNAKLEEKLKETELPGAVAVLIKDAAKRKKQLRLLTIIICLQLLLTVFGVFTFIQTSNNHVDIVRNCESSNEARANSRKIWDYILDQPAPTPPTPEQQARIDKFKKLVVDTYMPRNCENL